MTLRSRRTKPRRRARVEPSAPSLVGSGMRRGRAERRSSRVRDLPYMMWIKTLPCVARFLGCVGECSGTVEADHDNRGRGMAQKSSDRRTIPLCTLHHRQRTDFSGAFRAFDKARMREWFDEALRDTAIRFRARFPYARDWAAWVASFEPK